MPMPPKGKLLKSWLSWGKNNLPRDSERGGGAVAGQGTEQQGRVEVSQSSLTHKACSPQTGPACPSVCALTSVLALAQALRVLCAFSLSASAPSPPPTLQSFNHLYHCGPHPPLCNSCSVGVTPPRVRCTPSRMSHDLLQLARCSWACWRPSPCFLEKGVQRPAFPQFQLPQLLRICFVLGRERQENIPAQALLGQRSKPF